MNNLVSQLQELDRAIDELQISPHLTTWIQHTDGSPQNPNILHLKHTDNEIFSHQFLHTHLSLIRLEIARQGVLIRIALHERGSL